MTREKLISWIKGIDPMQDIVVFQGGAGISVAVSLGDPRFRRYCPTERQCILDTLKTWTEVFK